MNFERLPTSWAEVLPPEAVATAEALSARAASERERGVTIYPSQSDIFRAYHLTPPSKVKVCIIGQDPYHQPGQAIGLAFAVNKSTPLPRSLRNIYKELEADIGAVPPTHGDLSRWAEEGVLMLNTVLTVERDKANSHARWGWQTLTTATISALSNLPQKVVFILWGNQAKQTAQAAGVDLSKPNVITSAHPSPLSANRGFFGSKPFSKTNTILSSNSETPIMW